MTDEPDQPAESVVAQRLGRLLDAIGTKPDRNGSATTEPRLIRWARSADGRGRVEMADRNAEGRPVRWETVLETEHAK